MDKEAILNKHLTYGADTYDAGQRQNILRAMEEYAAETIVKKDEEIARLKADNEKYVGIAGDMMKMSNELIELRKFKEQSLTNK